MRKFKCRECKFIVEGDNAPRSCPKCRQYSNGFVDVEFELSNLKLEDFYSKPEEVTELELSEEEVGKLTDETIKKFPKLKFVDIWTDSELEFPKALLNANIEKMVTCDFEPKQLKDFDLKHLQIWWSDDLISEVVKYFPKLESLLIEADEDIYFDEKILQLKNLKFLQMSTRSGKVNYKINDLSKLSNLESLRVVNSNLIDDFVYFSTCKNLKKIEVTNCESFKSFPREIENLQGIEELKLLENENMSLENIKGLKNLKKLSIGIYNDDNFDFIKDLSNLEDLEVIGHYETHDKNWNVIKINIPNLKNMKNLKHLTLKDFKNLRNLDFLSGMDLESLKLNTEDSIRYETLNGFSSIYKMKNLKDVDFTCTSINTVKNKKELLEELLKMDSLENLESFVSQSVSIEALKNSSRKAIENYLENLKQGESFLENFIKFSERDDLNAEIVEKELSKIVTVDILFAEERVQKEENVIGVEVLDNLVERFLSELSDEILINLLKATAIGRRGEYSIGIKMQDIKLHNLRESYLLSKIIVEEAIKRKSIVIQKYCCDYYFTLSERGANKDIKVKEWLENEYFEKFELEVIEYFYEKAYENEMSIESLGLFSEFVEKTKNTELAMKALHVADFPIGDKLGSKKNYNKKEDLSELEELFRTKNIDDAIWRIIDNRHFDIVDMGKKLDVEKISSIFVEKVKAANQLDINEVHKLYVFEVLNKVLLEVDLKQAAQLISEKIDKEDISTIKQIISYSEISRNEEYMEFVCTLQHVCLGKDIEELKEELNLISKLNVKAGALYGPAFFGMWGLPAENKIVEKGKDPDTALKLWDVSEKLTGIKYQISVNK